MALLEDRSSAYQSVGDLDAPELLSCQPRLLAAPA